MNKKDFINKLIEKTGRNETECVEINNIIENNFIIGKRNKEKMMNDFMQKLKMSESEADELYNICAELIVKGIFK